MRAVCLPRFKSSIRTIGARKVLPCARITFPFLSHVSSTNGEKEISLEMVTHVPIIPKPDELSPKSKLAQNAPERWNFAASIIRQST